MVVEGIETLRYLEITLTQFNCGGALAEPPPAEPIATFFHVGAAETRGENNVAVITTMPRGLRIKFVVMCFTQDLANILIFRSSFNFIIPSK